MFVFMMTLLGLAVQMVVDPFHTLPGADLYWQVEETVILPDVK